MDQYNTHEIFFPLTVIVTGQEVDLSGLSSAQKDFYKNLFFEIVELYVSKKQQRMIIGLAGPTGAGKSVMVALFKEFAKQIALPFAFQTLGIDAFHYRNDFLESHKDNIGETLKNRKGRYDTYDVLKLVQLLKEFKSKEAVSLPEYSRVTHDPIDTSTVIAEEHALLLLEGLWLFYDKNKWEEVLPLLDYKIFVDADKEKVRGMVVERHQRGGRSNEDANKYYDVADVANYELVMSTKQKADKIIFSYHEIV